MTADLVVLHWNGGAGDESAIADLMHQREIRGSPQTSYNVAVGRQGGVVELIQPRDAPMAQGDGWLPPGYALETGRVACELRRCRDGAVSPQARQPHRRRYANLRSYAVCLANIGWQRSPFDRRADVPWVARARAGVRASLWEAYTDQQIAALVSVLEYARAELPSLRWICGHEDMTHSGTLGKAGGKVDPGPAFPWETLDLRELGLRRVEYVSSEKAWVVR